MMTRAKKAEEISNLSDRFGRAKAAFLVDFKGMNVEQVTTLRKTLTPIEAEMKVVRNTLAKLALKDHPDADSALSEDFTGTNALVFAYGEAPASAKALSEFSKDVEELQIKTGYMAGKRLDEAQINFLATLPGKDELRAQLLGTLAAPMTKFVRTLNEVPSGFLRVLAAKKDSGN
ncbi:MAG: 50S ribosomal protein L10 [Bdellovibrionaceae bacterium]|nr:50S ribosomal protein L10 [Pseudobdellovibrionaceae bacterium]